MTFITVIASNWQSILQDMLGFPSVVANNFLFQS